jgi:uncharacterized alpha-E superfamily protein
MLSRTADSLYWLSRYIERAEAIARILEATMRLANLPSESASPSSEWASAIATAGCADAFYAHHAQADERSVCDFQAFSTLNPSSIKSCIEIARTNARAVRTALTSEMWETINGAWIELKRLERADISSNKEFVGFLDFVKQASLSFDGCAYRTMLRNDAYWFTRLGVCIERADTTARILDVKYHVLLPESERVGGSLDYFQWATILREVSALTAYHWVYRQSVKPLLVADLLILNRQMPRSIASCYATIVEALDSLALAYGRQGKAQRDAHAILSQLSKSDISEIFTTGLHEFILGMISSNNRLGQTIHQQYML